MLSAILYMRMHQLHGIYIYIYDTILGRNYGDGGDDA